MSVRKSPSPSASARILLVDDNAHGLTARKTLLTQLGYKVSTASSAHDALEQFDEHPFQLVITDYKMPKMDGLELIKLVRKRAPAVPVVLVTGYADSLGLNEESTGADAVIQKSSHEVSHLERIVARLLTRRPPKKAVRKKAVAKETRTPAKTKHKNG